MAEYGPVDPEDHATFRRFTRYGFAAEQGPLAADEPVEFETGLFDLRGLYDGELKTGCKRYVFEAQVRGETVQVGGLGALATPPEHRRQGYGRELCRELCREYAEEGVGLVALWPFSTPFYRRMGWATTNDRYECVLPPEVLPTHRPAGRYRRLGVEDWEQLRPVEAASGDGVGLSMRRSETWWRERTLTGWTGDTDPFVYGYEREGQLAGYLVYTVREGETNERTLSVELSGHVDREAFRSLLEFLRRHGAQVDRVELTQSVDSRLLALVTDPDRVTCERVAGPMARLTALDPLGRVDWTVLDRPLTLSVEDPLRTETGNRLRVSSGGVEAAPDSEAAVRVDIGTLTQLYLGRYDPASAERLAGLTVVDDSRREALAAVFPEQQVRLREFF